MSGAPERLEERLRGWSERRPRLGPETVHVDVANACNLRCVTCWNHAAGLAAPKSPEWKRLRMAPELFERAVDGAAALGAERIIVSGGGEPFTHPEIESLLAHVKSRGLRLTVITNGTLCSFERLAALGVDQLLLNLASATPQTYARYHPGEPPRTFERLLEGARSLAGKVNLVQVVNHANADEVPRMVELAAGIGARCSFKVGDAPAGTERWALSAPEVAGLLAEGIPKARKRAKRLGVKTNLDAFADQLGDPAGRARPAHCFAGYLYARVWVDGTVFFCCEHVPVGSLATASLAEIWGSREHQAVRDRLHAGEWLPGCGRCGKHDLNFAALRALQALRAEGRLP